ncbi:MAG: excinuclease ABC subunit UvrA [Rhodospirillales bacterium]|jgi:excinuclease ABC subunit A|nr:excinuclease ABC subunit UvrA [Rhodospirillales bacterium]MDP7216030.1 excinuclease ABC subunit UvrA [Rhodospirillales bacterium]HIJ44210.1 excinuclease ABC subunit UvrA [Rhodospirillaceae bacterium]HIJ92999.1 excinuclease ABC subunit UvrA [Rhodospirillaceae bacterium]HJP54836.1 excinuclease ABC subunit UvrA [Rhodospirillales bacterium]
MDKISVRGARQHNLQNIDVEIPRDALTVITGLSGSGKSSLAFDTIYAEGQRRYVESLSAYARQFLELMQKPDVDLIEGLSPAISIEQKTTSKNPRSTVGTVTEIHDYMRLLFARAGVPHSPATGLPIESQTVSQMVDRVMEMAEGTRLLLLGPVVRGRKGEYKRELQDLGKRGFQRLKVDGAFCEIDDVPALNKKVKHSIEVVVDRIVVRDGLQSRLADSFETALSLADGLAFTEDADSGERTTFSAKFACPVSGFTIDEIEPRLFSFNNPFGACPACDGLGTEMYFDPQLVVADDRLSLGDGAIAPWANSSSPYYQQTLASLAEHFGFRLSKPFGKLSAAVRETILFGSGDEPVTMRYHDGKRPYDITKPFEGVIPNMERRWRETDSSWVRDELGRYQTVTTCDSCRGHRLKPEALAVKVAGLHIGEVTGMSIAAAASWFAGLEQRLSAFQRRIARRILREINERLEFLVNVGLDYLTLSRRSGTLSGGESQRIRLASQIGSGLTGVLYVLDEPSIGLHQRDNSRLLTTLKRLRDLGNTVIVVEHDEDAIMSADYLLDMGPGAGVHGGRVVAKGAPKDIMAAPQSLTGQYLSGSRQVPMPGRRRKSRGGRKLTVKGARANNLAGITVDFPLATFTCITGVSGSGKSTLVVDTLYRALARRLHGARLHAGKHDGIDGLELIDKVVDIDQSPIGRTPRSNPATYTGAFTPIREWFSALPEARARGYKTGRFSFNVKGGRCEVCQGDGLIKVEMHFLPDLYVQCDNCKGKRYNRETLEIHFRGKSIAEVLDMTVDEALEFFKAVPAIRNKFLTLQKVGLGYIHLGQQATTLSGGEAQRVKLAKELSKRATGKTLYILDEPTTGLHFADVEKLLEVLHALVDTGNTVVVIEHNLEVIKTADWIIDLGPEGGDAGGGVVATGTPEDVAAEPASYTGRYLAPYFKKAKARKRA